MTLFYCFSDTRPSDTGAKLMAMLAVFSFPLSYTLSFFFFKALEDFAENQDFAENSKFY